MDMPQHQLTCQRPSLVLACACGHPMRLASIEPHPRYNNLERYTYDCLECGFATESSVSPLEHTFRS